MIGKKLTAAILSLSFMLSAASCTFPGGTAETDETHTRSTRAEVEENIVETSQKIANALANCDIEALSKCCDREPRHIGDVMPVIEETDDEDAKPDKKLMVENMIASTITCVVDKNSYKTEFWSDECSIDAVFSYKDYHKVLQEQDIFLNPGDFNSRLMDVTDTVDITFTLKFKKLGSKTLLKNADDLSEIYSYTDTTLNYMKSFFDMVDDIYMTGDKWDPVTESYTDTDTFEIVLELNELGHEYIWEYVYRVSNETSPKWTHLFTSGKVVEKYPDEIHVIYTQDTIIEEGFYCILFYNYYDDTIIGYEFDVFTSDTSETSETDETGETSEPG